MPHGTTFSCSHCRAGLSRRTPSLLQPSRPGRSRRAHQVLDGSGTWEIKDKMLILTKAGTLGGPIRRPSALAVLQSEPLVRTTVQVEMRSTAREEVKNRDLEI